MTSGSLGDGPLELIQAMCWFIVSSFFDRFILEKINLNNAYMGDFTQRQQKYTSTGENCDIAIPLIFHPVILCLLFGCVSTQITNLRAENNFANMLKIVQKSSNLRDFWTISNKFAKLIFALNLDAQKFS